MHVHRPKLPLPLLARQEHLDKAAKTVEYPLALPAAAAVVTARALDTRVRTVRRQHLVRREHLDKAAKTVEYPLALPAAVAVVTARALDTRVRTAS